MVSWKESLISSKLCQKDRSKPRPRLARLEKRIQELQDPRQDVAMTPAQVLEKEQGYVDLLLESPAKELAMAALSRERVGAESSTARQQQASNRTRACTRFIAVGLAGMIEYSRASYWNQMKEL